MPILFLLVALLAAEPSADLRVATFNIRLDTPQDGADQWPKRSALVFGTIKRMEPDLLGIQEALPHQFDELKAALPEYESLGVGRIDGKREGEMAPLAYKTKRFEKLAEGHFWLSDTPETAGSRGWDAALPRTASWVKLRERGGAGAGGGRVILFANTHFDHKGAQARAEAAKLLRARLEKLAEGSPVIVVGDFNATEDEPPFATLVKEGRLTDSYRVIHPEPKADKDGTFHGFKGGTAGRRIDWILHSREFETTACEVVHDNDAGRYPSDHYPVAATIRWAKPSAKPADRP